MHHCASPTKKLHSFILHASFLVALCSSKPWFSTPLIYDELHGLLLLPRVICGPGLHEGLKGWGISERDTDSPQATSAAFSDEKVNCVRQNNWPKCSAVTLEGLYVSGTFCHMKRIWQLRTEHHNLILNCDASSFMTDISTAQSYGLFETVFETPWGTKGTSVTWRWPLVSESMDEFRFGYLN